MPGFFLRTIVVPPDQDRSDGDYREVTVSADSEKIAIEQFDAEPAARVVFGFADGWQEQESDGGTGRRWRWLTERGELRVRGIGRPLVLHLEGESPRKYYARPSRLLVRIAEHVLLNRQLDSDFSLDAPIPAALVPSERDEAITLETDQTFVPAEHSRRTADHRHLGLRIFTCRVSPAS